MRFKEGDSVEVMNYEEVPVSWCVAEILHSYRHSYHVRYASYPGVPNKQMVEMVSAKFVRPCPPLLQGLERWSSGDIVEVFQEFFWKIAVILKVVGSKKRNKINLQDAALQSCYSVRLLGSSVELVVDKMNIRTRQTWSHGKWIVTGQSSLESNDGVTRKSSASNSRRKMSFQVPQSDTKSKFLSTTDYVDIQYPVLSSRSLKKTSPFGSSTVEACFRHARKLRVIEKEGKKQPVDTALMLEKVDDVAYPEEHLGGKKMRASFNIISNGYNQKEREKRNVTVHNSMIRSSELNTSESDACSVGSCSVTNQSPKNCFNHFVPTYGREIDTDCSDSESSYGSEPERENIHCLPEEGIDVSIRRLELCAYRSTLEALYASGPLSWEQEALLTNLRITLHISNDEHLKELKHLISHNTAISVKQ